MRLGPTFHRSFALRRNQVQDVLDVAYRSELDSDDGNWTRQSLRLSSSIGTRQAESAPRYAYGAGLLDKSNKLTLFGKIVHRNDPMLEKYETMWLMHYFFSAPHGFGPTYWNEIVRTRFRTSDSINKVTLTEQIADHIKTAEGRELSPRYARSCANIFLNSYTTTDGWAALGILEKLDEEQYLVKEPEELPARAFNVALVDFWVHRFPGRITINLEELYAEGGLTSLFMIGAGRINNYLHVLQQEGVVDVFRVAPPYQVALLDPDPAFALERLYSDGDAY